jgi:hypothetical protein
MNENRGGNGKVFRCRKLDEETAFRLFNSTIQSGGFSRVSTRNGSLFVRERPGVRDNRPHFPPVFGPQRFRRFGKRSYSRRFHESGVFFPNIHRGVSRGFLKIEKRHSRRGLVFSKKTRFF